MKFILKILLLSIAASSLLFTQKWEKVELPNFNNRGIFDVLYIDSSYIAFRDDDSLFTSKDLYNWKRVTQQKKSKYYLKYRDSTSSEINKYVPSSSDKIFLESENVQSYNSLDHNFYYKVDDKVYKLNEDGVKLLFKNDNFKPYSEKNGKKYSHFSFKLFMHNNRIYSYVNRYLPDNKKYHLTEDIDLLKIFDIDGNEIKAYDLQNDFGLKDIYKVEVLNNQLFISTRRGYFFINLNSLKDIVKLKINSNNYLNDMWIYNGLLHFKSPFISYDIFYNLTTKETKINTNEKQNIVFPNLLSLSKLWGNIYEFNFGTLNEYNKDYKLKKSAIISENNNVVTNYFLILDIANDYFIMIYDDDVYKIYRNNLKSEKIFDFNEQVFMEIFDNFILKHQYFNIKNDTLFYEYSRDFGESWQSAFTKGFNASNLVYFDSSGERNKYEVLPELFNDCLITNAGNYFYISKLGGKIFNDSIQIETGAIHYNMDRCYILDSANNQIKYFDENCELNTISTKLPEGYNFHQIHYDQGYLYATDGYVLYRLKLEDEQVENYTDNSGLITVSPNMASDVINVTSYADASENSFEVYDVSGRRYSLEFKSFDNNNYEVDISDLPKGKYFIRIEDTEISTSFYRE